MCTACIFIYMRAHDEFVDDIPIHNNICQTYRYGYSDFLIVMIIVWGELKSKVVPNSPKLQRTYTHHANMDNCSFYIAYMYNILTLYD